MFVYIDQNILGYLGNGRIDLPVGRSVDWVYSDEHFNEIARGSDISFLERLKGVKARQIIQVLDGEWRITDQCRVDEYSCPLERYHAYLKARDEVSFDESLITDFLARLLGADNLDSVRTLPTKLLGQVESLLSQVGESNWLSHFSAKVKAESKLVASKLGSLIESDLAERLPLEVTREAFGIPKGNIGHLKSETIAVV